MKYFKRFRPTGEPFFVSENGTIVSEAVAQTNLVESASLHHASVSEFFEETFSGESRRIQRNPEITDVSARERMDEAFARRLDPLQETTQPIRRCRQTPQRERMEEAFERFLQPNH